MRRIIRTFKHISLCAIKFLVTFSCNFLLKNDANAFKAFRQPNYTKLQQETILNIALKNGRYKIRK